MKCPYCQADSRVYDTRHTLGGIWRRRKCQGCGARFTTLETVEVLQVGRPVGKGSGLRVEGSVTNKKRPTPRPQPLDPTLTPHQRAVLNLLKDKMKAKQGG